MSTHNIGFYEDLTKIIFELSSKYHQIRTLFLLLRREENKFIITKAFSVSMLKLLK